MGTAMTAKKKSTQGKRSFVRITQGQISKLCEIEEIIVKVVADEATHIGALVDISAVGVAVALPTRLEVDTVLQVSLRLGIHGISCQGTVRQAQAVEGAFVVGIRFDQLSPRDAAYIDSITQLQMLIGQLNETPGGPVNPVDATVAPG